MRSGRAGHRSLTVSRPSGRPNRRRTNGRSGKHGGTERPAGVSPGVERRADHWPHQLLHTRSGTAGRSAPNAACWFLRGERGSSTRRPRLRHPRREPHRATTPPAEDHQSTPRPESRDWSGDLGQGLGLGQQVAGIAADRLDAEDGQTARPQCAASGSSDSTGRRSPAPAAPDPAVLGHRVWAGAARGPRTGSATRDQQPILRPPTTGAGVAVERIGHSPAPDLH